MTAPSYLLPAGTVGAGADAVERTGIHNERPLCSSGDSPPERGSGKRSSSSSSSNVGTKGVEDRNDDFEETDASTFHTGEGRTIRVLPQRVVNLISAGEVVQRPASAVKELLENSIDAHATSISVRVEFSNNHGNTSNKGGSNTSRLSLLSVSDDGSGISRQDLALAAQRHATSKLKEASDLKSIQTLGFRGEALSSMSCVAQLTVTSRTAQSNVAYMQRYVDGAPTLDDPSMCARQVGTTVSLEELFHNLPSRQCTMLQPAEYARILQVVQMYAIHGAAKGIGFHCERVTHKSNESNHNNTSTTTSSSVDINTGCLPSIRAVRNLRKLKSRTNSSSNNTDDGDGEAVVLKRLQLAATQDAIAHLYGYKNLTDLACHLSSSQEDGDDKNQSDDKDPRREEARADPGFVYLCTGCVTTSASSSSSMSSSTTNKQLTKGRQSKPALNQQQHHHKARGQLVLFVNHRLVECAPIKRAVESAYQSCGIAGGGGAASSSSNTPWFAYLNVIVPSHNVDVNVHPSKQHVTMLHLDRICRHLQQCLLECLAKQGHSFKVAPSNGTIRKNPYDKQDKKRKVDFTTPTAGDEDSDSDSDSQVPAGDEGAARTDAPSSSSRPNRKVPAGPPSKKPATTTASSSRAAASIAPSKLVRTNRSSQVGALEPFLVSTAPSQLSATQQSDRRLASSTRFSISSTSSTQSSSSSSSATRETTPRSTPHSSASPSSESPKDEFLHDASCPLAKNPSGTSDACVDSVDMSQPGAFAVLASMCKCRQDKAITLSQDLGGGTAVKLVRQAWVRPKRVVPTDCRYTSVSQLRRRIDKAASREWTSKLRKAVFVGVASRHRSLIQCGEELVEIHHGSLATALFYQLALWRFAGADVARLKHALDIEVLVGSAAQLEEDLSGHADDDDVTATTAASSIGSLPKISETDRRMADQVAKCLLQHAELLSEYFSIVIEDHGGKAHLVGLPVLLEGYMPAAHGIPHFLLRLATEVDWAEEKPCFHGVCRELGNYYGMLDTDPAIYHQVRHMLFPAISSLLVPTADMVNDPSALSSPIRVLTSLSKLFRVFERC